MIIKARTLAPTTHKGTRIKVWEEGSTKTTTYPKDYSADRPVLRAAQMWLEENAPEFEVVDLLTYNRNDFTFSAQLKASHVAGNACELADFLTRTSDELRALHRAMEVSGLSTRMGTHITHVHDDAGHQVGEEMHKAVQALNNIRALIGMHVFRDSVPPSNLSAATVEMYREAGLL